MKVVRLWSAHERAYTIGRNAYKESDLSSFDKVSPTDHGYWDTRYLPVLRSLAGFGDPLGKQTFTNGDRKVFVIEHERSDTGEVMQAYHLLDELIEAFCEGATDQVEV